MAGTMTMGTTLTIKKKGSETADTVIASLTSIGEITVEREEIDVTTLDSPNGAKEFIHGAIDAGSMDIEGNIVDGANLEKFGQLFDSNEQRDFVAQTKAGAKVEFSGRVASLKYGEKTVDGLDTFSATVRLSGKPVFTKAPAGASR